MNVFFISCFIQVLFFFNKFEFIKCHQFLDHVEKRLDKIAKINFKIYDLTKWIANNYNFHIARYLKK